MTTHDVKVPFTADEFDKVIAGLAGNYRHRSEAVSHYAIGDGIILETTDGLFYIATVENLYGQSTAWLEVH